MTKDTERRGCGHYWQEIREILKYSWIAFLLHFGDGMLPEDLPPPPDDPPSGIETGQPIPQSS